MVTFLLILHYGIFVSAAFNNMASLSKRKLQDYPATNKDFSSESLIYREPTHTSYVCGHCYCAFSGPDISLHIGGGCSHCGREFCSFTRERHLESCEMAPAVKRRKHCPVNAPKTSTAFPSAIYDEPTHASYVCSHCYCTFSGPEIALHIEGGCSHCGRESCSFTLNSHLESCEMAPAVKKRKRRQEDRSPKRPPGQ